MSGEVVQRYEVAQCAGAEGKPKPGTSLQGKVFLAAPILPERQPVQVTCPALGEGDTCGISANREVCIYIAREADRIPDGEPPVYFPTANEHNNGVLFRQIGRHSGQPTAASIARSLEVPPGVVEKTVDRLVKAGIVERLPAERNKAKIISGRPGEPLRILEDLPEEQELFRSVFPDRKLVTGESRQVYTYERMKACLLAYPDLTQSELRTLLDMPQRSAAKIVRELIQRGELLESTNSILPSSGKGRPMKTLRVK